MDGWILLHRKLLDNPLWRMETFTKGQAWVDLLLLANHQDGKICIRGNIVDIKRGQVGWSEVRLADRWGWSRNKVRRFFDLLLRENMIQKNVKTFTTVGKNGQKRYSKQNSTNKYVSSIITINRYDEYQKMEQQTKQRWDSRKTADDTLTKNDKEEKRNNNNNAHFEIFWDLYPRKVGKGSAKKAYMRQSNHSEINEALKKQLPLLKKSEQKYIPYPATWLNQERWKDELLDNKSFDGETLSAYVSIF